MGQKSSRLVEGHRLCEHVTLGVFWRGSCRSIWWMRLCATPDVGIGARQLLPHLVVYYVRAPALYAHASYDA